MSTTTVSLNFSKIPCLLFVALSILGVAPSAMGVEFRSIDGSGNNQMEPGWGIGPGLGEESRKAVEAPDAKIPPSRPL